jgi:hypothetical protein
MEVRDEKEQLAYIRALDMGWHVAADGSDDAHDPDWGNEGTWLAVLAPGLSRPNILDALDRRHCYSSGDRNCRLVFHVNEALMGDIVEQPVSEAKVVVGVNDPDGGDTIAKIELFEDGKVIQTDEPAAQQRRWEVKLNPAAGKHYYFVKVTEADKNCLWSAPIWVTGAERRADAQADAEAAAACMTRMKLLGLVVMMWAQDHDEALPPAENLDVELEPYLASQGEPGLQFGYAYNLAVAGKRLADITNPAETVLFYESTLGTLNAADTGESQPKPGRHHGGNIRCYADGHVKWGRDQ